MSDEQQPHPDFPEHEKLAKIAEDSQMIGEFLDLGPWTLCCYSAIVDEFVPMKIEDALAQWFGIDQKKIDAEKDAMLRGIRETRELNALYEAETEADGSAE